MGKFAPLLGLILVLQCAGCAVPARALLRVDMDGDGHDEELTLLQRPHEVAVTIRSASLHGGRQTLSFGVDPRRQDAVCGLPVTLEVTESGCGTETAGEEPLEGCRASPRSRDVALVDGRCDSIHMYWNHDAGEVWWWRL